MKFTLGILLGLLIGCASTISGQLRFQDRELLVHPDKPGLGYPYKITVCVPNENRITRIFKKEICHEEVRDDFYDMTDKTVRKSLIDADFRCVSSSRFKY